MSDEKQENSNLEQEVQTDINLNPIGSVDPVDESKALAEKYRNDFLYLRAEFDNYKKHAIKERSELLRYGSERLLLEVLAVMDNFDRALSMKVTPESIETYVQGVSMTANELKSMIQKFGVVEVVCDGMVFDPMIHEALGAEETDSVKEGFISKVFKKAYKLHDKIIRPAQVIVAKAVNKSTK